MRRAWHLLSGEFPPRLGGVSEYTSTLASALADAGDEVVVWTPGPAASAHPAVRVELLEDGFSRRGLRDLGRGLDRWERPGRLLLQYVPQAFGARGMNLALPLFLAKRREPLWVMFHEVAVPFGGPNPARRAVMSVAQRAMAAALLARAERVFLSTEAWRARLRSLDARRRRPLLRLPIPSSLPVPEATARPELSADLVGHYGTYGEATTPLLEPVLLTLLRSSAPRRALLLGRGGQAFAAGLLRSNPWLSGRLEAPGELPADELAARLSRCAVAIQPYVDGVSTRRTTAMAALALGVPLATNLGPLSDMDFRDFPGVGMAAAPEAAALVEVVERLLAAPARSQRGAEEARAEYRARWSFEATVKALREEAERAR